MLLTETHCHTAEVSQCARVPAAEIPALHKQAGYGALVVTDHYNLWTLDALAGDRQTQIERWLRGYQTVKEGGERLGLRVFLGMELALASGPEDYLIYGFDEAFLFRYPRLVEYGMKRIRSIADSEGLLIFQAHPFRQSMRRAPAKLLDGVEVFNGNPRHDSHNDRALRFAERHGLLRLAGSDFHQYDDLGRGGILLPDDVADNRRFVSILKEGNVELYSATAG